MSGVRGYDRFLASVDHLISKINAHLPKSRKSLQQLLTEEEPSVETVEGSKHLFKRRDLERASKIIPKQFHESLMLPILIIRRCERGKGVYTVSGGDVEKQIVREILDLRESIYQHGDLTVYRIQIQKLISTLGSLIVIGFETPPEKYGNYDYY